MAKQRVSTVVGIMAAVLASSNNLYHLDSSLATSLGSGSIVVSAFTPSQLPTKAGHAMTTTMTRTTTGLHSHLDRARMERDLEESMGDDWRTFRAKLVAQEQQEQELLNLQQQNRQQNSKHNPSSKNKDSSDQDDKSLDSKKDPNNVAQALGQLLTKAFVSLLDMDDENKEHNTDNGKNKKKASSESSVSDVLVSPEDLMYQDPFATAAELPVFMKPKRSDMITDKHNWAHPMSHLEPGCVLIANEQLGGVFYRSVVLIVHHDNKEQGTTGLIINKPLKNKTLYQLATEHEQHKVQHLQNKQAQANEGKKGTNDDADEYSTNLDTSMKFAFCRAPVGYGGPVQPNDYAVIHGYGHVDRSIKVAPGVFVGGGTVLADAQVDTPVLFVKGRAHWIPGQLEREIEKGVWHVAATAPDFLLRHASVNANDDDTKMKQENSDLWTEILSCMGGKYAKLAAKYGSDHNKKKNQASEGDKNTLRP